MSNHSLQPTEFEPKVAAVVVTFKRPEVLFRTLDAVVTQTTRMASILVVDNAADITLADQLSSRYPVVRYVPSPENLGYGAGLALGMRCAQQAGEIDWYWLLDDDSPPSINAVKLAIAVAIESDERVGSVGTRGGHVRWGRIRHDLGLGTVARPSPADFLLIDGSIVSDEAIRRVGYPREDLFMMMEDFEYSTRVAESGLALIVRPADGSENLYMGSAAPWRGYYQSRNLLRIAVDRRSIGLVWGWVVRETGINAHHLWNRRWVSVWLRLRGAGDALRNRMGRVVDP